MSEFTQTLAPGISPKEKRKPIDSEALRHVLNGSAMLYKIAKEKGNEPFAAALGEMTQNAVLDIVEGRTPGVLEVDPTRVKVIHSLLQMDQPESKLSPKTQAQVKLILTPTTTSQELSIRSLPQTPEKAG